MTERRRDRAGRRRRAPGRSYARAAAALAVLALATPAACGGTSSGSDGQRATDGQAAAGAKWERGEDWRHVHQVLGYLEEHPPGGPVVYLVGGSAVRESTVSDQSWRREVERAGGPPVEVFNLGATNQTFDHNITMIERLPSAPSLVIIGVNVGRYTNRAPYRPGFVIPLPLKGFRTPHGDATIEPYAQHKFTQGRAGPVRKREMLDKWESERLPVFQEFFGYNAGRLEALVQVCLDRGFHPVILNMPLNLEIIGERMDEPRARYDQQCRAVAAKYDVPYIDWVPRIDLVSEDFVDNWHLIEPGRVKWQAELSALTVAMLRRYGLGDDGAAAAGADAPDAPAPDDDSETQ